MNLGITMQKFLHKIIKQSSFKLQFKNYFKTNIKNMDYSNMGTSI